MSNTLELEKKMNDAILAGKAMEAFEELYDEDVVMQENSDPPTNGKAANRQRELDFFATVEAIHGATVKAYAAGDDVSFAEWSMDLTLKGVGRITMEQVHVRRWKNGKIVHERFFHK